MSFRRKKADHKQIATEKAWIDRHWPTLKQIGLPPIIYVDYDHWSDFLTNGDLDHHEDPTHFSFTQLSKEQMRQLLAFIEAECQPAGMGGVRQFLRVRLGICLKCGEGIRGRTGSCPKCAEPIPYFRALLSR